MSRPARPRKRPRSSALRPSPERARLHPQAAQDRAEAPMRQEQDQARGGHGDEPGSEHRRDAARAGAQED